MGIKFASGGFLTTVQDMGRTGYQESGMSVSGVMDQRSAAIANILVGNDENEAVLEVTLMGPMMEFTEDNIIAVTGGNLVPKVNGKANPKNYIAKNVDVDWIYEKTKILYEIVVDIIFRKMLNYDNYKFNKHF